MLEDKLKPFFDYCIKDVQFTMEFERKLKRKYMTSQNFAYWLNGFFEINGEITEPLTPNQVKVIKEHLKLVFATETPGPFCQWLDGYFALSGDVFPTDKLTLEVTKKIAEKLNGVFDHVIKSDQPAVTGFNPNKPSSNSNTVYRC